MNLLIIFTLAVATPLLQDGVATASATDELHDDLLLTYDKSQHPRNAVRLVYEIYFQDCPIPGASGDLISTVKETQRWTDDRLVWDPSEHGSVNELDVSPNEVWTPDVDIDPNIGSEVGVNEISLVLKPNGLLHRTRTLEISSSCDPFGGAWKCQLRFVAWNDGGSQFTMRTSPLAHEITVCPSNVKIEEYNTRIQQVGEIGSLSYHYVVDMVIRTH